MRNLLLLLLFCTSTFTLLAQTGTVRGFVYDKDNGEPIIFTNVVIKGTTTGAATDVNGFYQITNIPEGTQILTVSSLGYETLEEAVEVIAGDIVTKKLFLSTGAININTVTISADKQDAQTQVQISVEKITPQAIKSLPSQGGEADLAQYLQVVPGVVFTGDQGGQLYIRGGSPVQNKVLLDGMIIYNPFHSIGLFSVFDTDLLRNADIYSGGFNAEYGGRISSVMDITTRDGNKNRISGKIGATTFGAKAMVEGPIKRPVNPGDGSSSFVLSAKRSYLDQTSTLLYDYVNDGAGLPFEFTDLYGKISLNGSNGSKLNLFGFNFNDRTTFREVSDLDWTTYGAGANFVVIPGETPTLIEGNFAFSNYQVNLAEQNLPPRSSAINGFNMGVNFKYFSGDNEFKYGLEVLGFTTDFIFSNAIGIETQQRENTTEAAGFFSYKLKAKRLVLEPSIRGQFYASLSELSIEPRIGLKYNITDNIRFKGAAGLYSQNLIAANSDRDVVNFFYGFLSGPEDLQNEFTEQDGTVREVDSRLQKSAHYIAGFEFDVTRKLTLNVEAYLKDFIQLVNTNRNKIFEDNLANQDQPETLRKDFIIENGDSRGIDLVAKYTEQKFNFWAVYSYQKSERWDGIQTYAPVFDRRHNVNLIGSYTFGKDKSWETNLRWNYGSALPFTPNGGFGQGLSFGGDIYGDYTTENPDVIQTRLGDLNSERLTAYHRLDFNLKKVIELSKHSDLEINAGVTNIYNRENIFYIARESSESVFQLPILPSLGASWTF